jgi:hypothetical protein
MSPKNVEEKQVPHRALGPVRNDINAASRGGCGDQSWPLKAFWSSIQTGRVELVKDVATTGIGFGEDSHANSLPLRGG